LAAVEEKEKTEKENRELLFFPHVKGKPKPSKRVHSTDEHSGSLLQDPPNKAE
jgi:hypothetical protein